MMADDPIRARLDELHEDDTWPGDRTRQYDALRAVLDLHWLTSTGYCYQCGIGPCSERRVIAEHLGVTDES